MDSARDEQDEAAARGWVHQINVSRGGVPKLRVTRAIVTADGLIGDYHNDERNHGGPLRAVCLYTLEQIERLTEEGHSIYPGATGENLTLRGIPLALLTPGARVEIGEETLLEITGYAAPCETIAEVFNTGDFTRISHKLHPGESRAYARVARGGEIHEGDEVAVWVAASGGAQ
jgi:MOSC domain-containing protein YiiM